MTISLDNAAKQTSRRWIIPMIVALAFFIEQFDTAALIISVPVIAADLGVEPLRLSLLVTAYVTSVVLFMPASGWLSNRFGVRRIFLAALSIYVGGSIGCSLSSNFEMLIAFRIVQGMGGAMMTPVGRLIMLRSFGRHELIAAMGLMTAPVLFGPLLGPLIGGLISSHADWRWLFLVNVPVVLCGLPATVMIVPTDTPTSRTRFDLRGFLLLSPGIVLLQFAIEMLKSPGVWRSMAALPAGLALTLILGYWLHASKRHTAALLDIGLLRSQSFRAGSIFGGLSRMGFNATPFLLPLYLHFILGYGPGISGTIVAMAIVGSLAAKPFNGWLVRRFGFRRTLAGSAVLGSLLIGALALYGSEVPLWLLAIHIIMIGAVQTIQYNTLNIISYIDVTPERLGAASSLGGIIQQLSMGMAVSWCAAVLGILGGGSLAPWHFRTVFVIAALLPLLATFGFLRLSQVRSGPSDRSRSELPHTND
jgi:EmrB/QacA subfamily drug resistance transporter